MNHARRIGWQLACCALVAGCVESRDARRETPSAEKDALFGRELAAMPGASASTEPAEPTPPGGGGDGVAGDAVLAFSDDGRCVLLKLGARAEPTRLLMLCDDGTTELASTAPTERCAGETTHLKATLAERGFGAGAVNPAACGGQPAGVWASPALPAGDTAAGASIDGDRLVVRLEGHQAGRFAVSPVVKSVGWVARRGLVVVLGSTAAGVVLPGQDARPRAGTEATVIGVYRGRGGAVDELWAP